MLKEECQWSFENGFAGKMAVHPAQVNIINTVFRSKNRVEWARQVVNAFGRDAEITAIRASDTGDYMGTPVLKFAQRIIEQSEKSNTDE